jgi:hypothetical protein
MNEEDPKNAPAYEEPDQEALDELSNGKGDDDDE